MVRLLQHPVALVLLCVSLIGTPVTYRGGASNPHPHMFLEFLMDAEAGAFDHHHHGDGTEPADAEHASHEYERAPDQELATSRMTGPDDRFGPSLSAFVVGDVGQLAYIVPQHALPQADPIERAFLPFERLPAGVAIPPIAPPPR